jgi:hypothetical protein
MGIFHKCIAFASFLALASCQPRWAIQGAYQFANNASLIQHDQIKVLKAPKFNIAFYTQALIQNGQPLLAQNIQFDRKTGRLLACSLTGGSVQAYHAQFLPGWMNLHSDAFGHEVVDQISLPEESLFHPGMASYYPLILDELWHLRVGQEYLITMVHPPKGNLTKASYYLEQKTKTTRIYLYRNDSNVGTLTYRKSKGKWNLLKADLMNQNVPYTWERLKN